MTGRPWFVLTAWLACLSATGCDTGTDGPSTSNDDTTSGSDASSDSASSDGGTDEDTSDYLTNDDWEAICVLYASCTADFEQNFGSLDQCVHDFMVQFGAEVGATCSKKCGSMKKCENSIPCILGCQEDSTRSYCPGYTGHELCCQSELPPNYCQTWPSNGACDCNGACDWDAAECGQ